MTVQRLEHKLDLNLRSRPSSDLAREKAKLCEALRSCAKLCEVDLRVTWREKRCERCNSEPGVAPKINLMQSLSDVSLTTPAYASIERSNGVVNLDHRRRGEGSKQRAWTNCCSQRECTPFRSRCASPDRGHMCWQPPTMRKVQLGARGRLQGCIGD